MLVGVVLVYWGKEQVAAQAMQTVQLVVMAALVLAVQMEQTPLTQIVQAQLEGRMVAAEVEAAQPALVA